MPPVRRKTYELGGVLKIHRPSCVYSHKSYGLSNKKKKKIYKLKVPNSREDFLGRAAHRSCSTYIYIDIYIGICRYTFLLATVNYDRRYY